MAEYIIKLNEAFYNDETGETVFKPNFVGQVIRCGDCKYYITDNKNIFKGCCKFHHDLYGFPMEKKLDDFCSNAERREIK